MTKAEMLVALKKGKKVTHKNFSEDEYMCIKDGMLVFEDGVTITLEEFWIGRNSYDWLTDWEIYK